MGLGGVTISKGRFGEDGGKVGVGFVKPDDSSFDENRTGTLWGLVNSLITVSVIGYCSLLYVMQPPFRAVNLRQIKETRRQNKSFLLFCLIMMSAVSTNPIVLLCALKIKRSREHWQAVDCGDEAGEYLRWKP